MPPEETIWTRRLSARQARAAGQALRGRGYAITTAKVRELGTALAIGNYLEPGNAATRHDVYDLVCEAAGMKPPRGK